MNARSDPISDSPFEGELRRLTLCFLIREDQVLLAMKKRGFGAGKWNGVGGKVEPSESLCEAAVREAQEEIGVAPLSLQRAAILRFYLPEAPPDPEWTGEVHVFLVSEWKGDPTETEEMAPRWFARSSLPFDAMWPDDALWLARVLDGETLAGDFLYDRSGGIERFWLKGLTE